MIHSRVSRVLLAGVALAALTSAAQAQGFAVRNQSTIATGLVMSGVAAGSASISSQYWNPATLAMAKVTTTENNFTFISPNSKITPTRVTSPNVAFDPGANLLARGDSGDQGNDALVPASYVAYRLNDRVVLGASINSPFGLGVKPDDNWAGQLYSYSSKLKTYQFNPAFSIQLTDTFSIGAGVQVMYSDASLKQGIFNSGNFPAVPIAAQGFPVGEFEGSGWGIGATVGFLWRVAPGTEIGVGYRSAISTELEGFWNFPGTTVAGVGTIPAYNAPGRIVLTTPDFITASFSHLITQQLKILGTVEWANWSRVRNIPVDYDRSALAGSPQALPFFYEDSWFYSLGMEYQVNDALAVRAGVGYNTSPVPDSSRNVRIPDNDRIWAGGGFTYKWSDRISVNFGYQHIWVEDAPINVVAGNPTFNASSGTFVGEAETNIHIVSLGLTVRWGQAAPPVVRKY